jgi:hypothetical protein
MATTSGEDDVSKKVNKTTTTVQSVVENDDVVTEITTKRVMDKCRDRGIVIGHMKIGTVRGIDGVNIIKKKKGKIMKIGRPQRVNVEQRVTGGGKMTTTVISGDVHCNVFNA